MNRWIEPLRGVELISMYPPEIVAFAVGVQMRTPGSEGAPQFANAETQPPNKKMNNADNRRFMGTYRLEICVHRAASVSALRMPALFSVAAVYFFLEGRSAASGEQHNAESTVLSCSP